MYWSTYKPGPHTISYLNGTTEMVLLDSKLDHAHGLTISNSYLYFINTPQAGTRFTIERVSLHEPRDREIVVSSKHQLPFSLTVLCGHLYWTDYSSKSLYGLELGSRRSGTDGETPSPKKLYESTAKDWNFNVPTTYAVDHRMDLDTRVCLERNLITAKPARVNVTLKPEVSSVKPIIAAETPIEEHRPLAIPSPSPALEFCDNALCHNGATCVSLSLQPFCL